MRRGSYGWGAEVSELSPCLSLSFFYLSGEKQAHTSDLCRCPSLEHLRKGLRHLDVLLKGAGQAGM